MKLKQNISQYYLIGIFLFIFIWGFLTYFNIFSNDFTCWDEIDLIINNTSIRSLDFQNIKNIFTPHKASTYQPLRTLSYAIDYYFWGLNPVGYNLHNILLHIFAAFFLYLILINIIPEIVFDIKQIRLTALIVTLFFLVHPINVEAVAAISGRKYTLMAFWGFLSFYFFIKSKNDIPYKILFLFFSALFYILSLLSSPFGGVFIFLFFLFDYCRVKFLNPIIPIKNNPLSYIPYLFILIIITVPIFLNLIGGDSGGADVEHYQGKAIYTYYVMLKVFVKYIINLIWPLWLNNRYQIDIPISFFSDCQAVIGFFLLVIIAAIIVWQVFVKKYKLTLFCFGWCLISWLPVSNIIPISTKIADRYIYLASIGFFLWIVLIAFKLKDIALLYCSDKQKSICNSLFLGIIILILLIFSFLTVQRNKIWKNCETLWEDSLLKDENNVMAHYNLGLYFEKQGRLEEAADEYVLAIKWNPFCSMSNHPIAQKGNDNVTCAKAYTGLGNIFSEKKVFSYAFHHYLQALNSNANYAPAHYNWANALSNTGSFKKAIYHYIKAIEISPNFADAYNNLGLALVNVGDYKNAIENYKKAIKFNPKSAQAHNNIGVALYTIGNLGQAIDNYLKALQIDPDFAQAHNNLGNAFLKTGDFEQAKDHFFKALKIKPDYSEAYFNLANMFLRLGRPDEAIKNYLKVIELRPDDAEAYNNLATLYARQGKLLYARQYFEKALKIKPDFKSAQKNLDIVIELLQH